MNDECRKCGAQFTYWRDKLDHLCAAPKGICPKCNLAKPCECDEE